MSQPFNDQTLNSRLAVGRVYNFLLALIFVAALARVALVAFENPGPTIGLFLLSEALTILLLALGKPDSSLNVSPQALAVTVGGSFFLLTVNPEDTGTKLVPVFLSSALQLVGAGLQVYAKLSLGKRFAVLPALKDGITENGPYRLIRNPIYLGYLIAHIGFLLRNVSLRNIVLLTIQYAFQATRIFLEEKTLAISPSYAAYKERVRWRMIPFVF